MNKKKVLIIVCVFIVVLSFFIPTIAKGFLPKASGTKTKVINYIGYVTATGEVVQKNKQQIVSTFPLIASEILTDAGDTVKKGQPLLKIDREQTARKLIEASTYASATGASSGTIPGSYEEVLKNIPEQILSDKDGIIGSVIVQKGSFINKGTPLFSLISEGDLIINVQVPENKIFKVKVGQPVEITGSGLDDKRYYGYVESISSSAKKVYAGTNQETVVDVTVSINNLDEKMKSGFSTKVRIITEPKKQIQVVPYESVMQDDTGKEYVYVFSKGFAVRKDIQTGIELGQGVEVVSGLNTDEIVISTPNDIKGNRTLVNIAS